MNEDQNYEEGVGTEDIPQVPTPIINAAVMCHEANRTWCVLNGDGSQPGWNDAPEWQTSSAIKGVVFHLKNPEAGDSASHDSWMAEKVATGWVYGEVKDPEATPPTHPCLVPFEELPDFQKIKDRVFRALVHAVLIDPNEEG